MNLIHIKQTYGSALTTRGFSIDSIHATSTQLTKDEQATFPVGIKLSLWINMSV